MALAAYVLGCKNAAEEQKDPFSCEVCSDLQCMSYAEGQRPVRELRRPGGGKPHGQVRSMTIPAGGQVCILPNAFYPFCQNLPYGCPLSAKTFCMAFT